jgi:hypothetical protein
MKSGCQNQVAFYCECENPALYMCQIHLGLHMAKQSAHNVVSLVISAGPEETKNVAGNIKTVLELLSDLRLQVLNTTKQAIEALFESQNSAIKMIEEYEKRMKNLYGKIKNNEDINKEDYKHFAKLKS